MAQMVSILSMMVSIAPRMRPVFKNKGDPEYVLIAQRWPNLPKIRAVYNKSQVFESQYLMNI